MDEAQAWNKHQIMDAFRIGVAEAEATKNLAERTTPYLVSQMKALVQDFSFHPRWGPLTHQTLASALLCTGNGPTMVSPLWTEKLKNTTEVVNLLADRISGDWRRLPKNVRKQLTPEAAGAPGD